MSRFRMLLLGIAFGVQAHAIPPDVKFEGIKKTASHFELTFTRGDLKGGKEREKVVLKDDDGAATLAVLQTFLLEITDKDGKPGKPVLTDRVKGSEHVKVILIDAMRRAELYYAKLSTGNKELSPEYLQAADALRKIRARLESVREPTLSKGDLDEIGEWLEKNLSRHGYETSYTQGGKTRTIPDIRLGGAEPFLSGSFTMRAPQYRVQMRFAARSRPFFSPDLQKVARDYAASKPEGGPAGVPTPKPTRGGGAPSHE